MTDTNTGRERIKIQHKGKRYVVIRDRQGVTGIEYNNVVGGPRRIFMDGKLAKEIRAANPQLFTTDVIDAAKGKGVL